MPLNKFDTSVLNNPDDVSVKPEGVFNTSVLGTPDYEDMTPEFQAYAELQHEADLNKRSYFERAIDLGGHLISGAKRAPGDVIRGTAMNVKDFYKPENPDDLFYETQFSIMTPTERARVAQRANRNIELGMDPKTAKEVALNESLQEKHEHANVTADAMMKVADSKKFQPLPGYEHPETFMQGVAGALGQQIVRLPLMLFPATRPAAIPVMQMEIAGHTYQHLIEEGVEPDRAKVAANMSAMAQTPLEFLGDLVAVKAILGPRAWKNYVSGIARTMGTEGAEEFAQQYPDAMATLWAMNPDVTLKDMWEEVSSRETFREALYAGAIGAVTGGIVAGGGIGVREGWNKYVTKKQQAINDQRTGTLLGALTKMRLGEKLTDEENTALDQAMTSLPMDAVNRLRFQSPIESDGRTTVFEGMRQILPDPVQHEKVMAILDSIAHSYAEITGKDPEAFYEDELIGAEKTTLEEFQKGVELDMAAQGRTQFQSGEEYGKEGAVTSKKGPGEKPTEATPKPDGGKEYETVNGGLPEGAVIKVKIPNSAPSGGSVEGYLGRNGKILIDGDWYSPNDVAYWGMPDYPNKTKLHRNPSNDVLTSFKRNDGSQEQIDAIYDALWKVDRKIPYNGRADNPRYKNVPQHKKLIVRNLEGEGLVTPSKERIEEHLLDHVLKNYHESLLSQRLADKRLYIKA